ncbi:URP2 protein, partial [Sapayoa aenigma]|nr:URP2 protein [Sapayoa aenigma]
MAGLKTASGEDIDGSFELQVEVEEEGAMGQVGATGQEDAMGQGDAVGQPGPQAALRILTLRVTGDLHIGGLMRLIVETIGEPRDWSDHALWWAQQRRWLLPPGPPLDALGIGGGSRLRFAPRHRPLRLRLPGGRVLRLRLDFARTPGRAAARVCGLLGIRHPEELSLLRPEEEERGQGRGRKGRAPLPAPPDLDLTHLRPRAGERSGGGAGTARWSWTPSLPWAPLPTPVSPLQMRPLSPRWPSTSSGPSAPGAPSRWLDTSRSLMEQDVVDDEELLLYFKYPCAMRLDPQDGLRIALLHEQARGALLAEEIDCTEEEMLLFAALQYQIDGAEWEDGDPHSPLEPQDLDTALDKLELSLEGGLPNPTSGHTHLPSWVPEIPFGNSPGFGPPLDSQIHPPKPLWDAPNSPIGPSKPPETLLGPPGPLTLPPPAGCEVIPDVDLRVQKFCIKLRVQTPEGMNETLLRCCDATQYARWVAGCRLASDGVSLSATVISAEAQQVLEVLGVQPGREDNAVPPRALLRPPPDPRRLLPPRFQRKFKAKQFTPQLLEVLDRVGTLSPGQARLRFVEAWRALPGFGLGHFVVRFQGVGRDEILAVGPSQLLRIDPGSGTITRSWRHSDLRQWDVNWDSQQVLL